MLAYILGSSQINHNLKNLKYFHVLGPISVEKVSSITKEIYKKETSSKKFVFFM